MKRKAAAWAASFFAIIVDDPAYQARGRSCRKAQHRPRLDRPDGCEAGFQRHRPGDPMLTRSFKAIGEAGGRILRVVHRSEGNDIVIVTVHFDRDAKP
jgi:hypothetical protein